MKYFGVCVRGNLYFLLLLHCLSSSIGTKILRNFDSEKQVMEEQGDHITSITCSCSNYTTLCTNKPELQICTEKTLRAIRWIGDSIRIFINKRSLVDEDSNSQNNDSDDKEPSVYNGHNDAKGLILVIIIACITCFWFGIVAIRRAIKNGYFDRFSVDARRNIPNT